MPKPADINKEPAMDTITTPRRIVRGILAGTLAVTAGLGLAACQTVPVTPEPEPVVYEDAIVQQERMDQAADRMRERYAGRPADRIEESLAREQALLEKVRARHAGQPADRLEEALARALQQ